MLNSFCSSFLEREFFNCSVDDCEDKVVNGSTQTQGYNTDIDPATGQAIDAGTPYAWTGSSRSFRQNETLDERESLFFGLQFHPSQDWNIKLDAQLSDRTQEEARHDLIYLQKRVTPGVTVIMPSITLRVSALEVISKS